MSISNVLASVAVSDIATASEWYERLLGRPPDSTPMPEIAEWKFERGGVLQVYQLAQRAGSGSCTLAVDNIDDEAARLARLGVRDIRRHDGPTVRTLMISDPDGNHIALAEALDPAMGR